MTPGDRFRAVLDRRPISGRVPHFELVFFLTMEAFGKVHPCHRSYSQWGQMEEAERILHRKDIAEVHVAIADRYEHSAIYFQQQPWDFEETFRQVDALREICGDRYFITIPGDVTYSIPNGDQMLDFCYRMNDEPEAMKREADEAVNAVLERAEKISRHGGVDGYILCADYCFNSGPFVSPAQFGEFIAPYLTKLIKGYRDLGFYTIKHTDGNIMPILDQLVQSNPHALHSLDPQGGVDIAEVKRLVGDRVCLVGNVNCGVLDNGSDDEVAESVRYALRQGMLGGGYIFSTSNCVYTGMRLERYELMLDIWRREGNYQPCESEDASALLERNEGEPER